MATMEELVLECCDGVKIGAQKWEAKSNKTSSSSPYGMGYGNPYGGMASTATTNNNNVNKIRILCVHGFLDNCASYYYLAPNLAKLLADNSNPYGDESNHVEIVAMDLPGHGKSSTSSPDAKPTVYLESVYFVTEVIRKLEWDKVKIILIGHSFGGHVCLAYASTFPENVEKLVLLESVSTQWEPPSTAVSNIRTHITSRQQALKKVQTKRILYPTLQTAIDFRVKAAGMNPGTQTISKEVAKELVERGTRKIGGGFQFCHDIHIDLPLMVRMTEEQVEVIYKNVKCPTARFIAQNGWPYSEENIKKEDEWLKSTNLVTKLLPGSHHFHADPETSKQVLNETFNFLAR